MRNIIVVFLFIFCVGIARAQFTQPTTAATIASTLDSVSVVSTSPQLDLALYNDAYDKYLRKVQFKQRNTIIFKNTGLQFTQTAYENWAAGGNNSYTIRATAYIEHHYVTPKFNIKSVFDAAFGILSTDGTTRKNEDWWNLSVTPGWRIGKKWDFTASLITKSQFANSYKAPGDTILVSSFFAPVTLTATVGISYVPPKGKLSIFLAPLSGNLLMVLNDELAATGGFGLDEPGQKFKPSFGAFFRLIYKDSFAKNKITYETKLESFWNYDSMPTIWWEHKMGFKFTNLLGANLYLLAQYNDKVKTPKAAQNNFFQLNESFGFGLVFNFTSKKPPVPADNPYTKARKKKK